MSENHKSILFVFFALIFLMIVIPSAGYALPDNSTNIPENGLDFLKPDFVIDEILSWYFENVNNDGLAIFGKPHLVNDGIGNSVGFDGKSDWLQVENIKKNEKLSNISISVWVKPNYEQSSKELVILSQQGAFELFINNYGKDHRVVFSIFDGIRWISVESEKSLPEDWTNVVAIYDGIGIAIFINGNLDSVEEISKEDMYFVGYMPYTYTRQEYGDIFSSHDTVIGASKKGAKVERHFSGFLDEVQLSFSPSIILQLRPTLYPDVKYMLVSDSCSNDFACSINLEFTTGQIKDDKSQIDFEDGKIFINGNEFVIEPDGWRGTIPLKGGLLTFTGNAMDADGRMVWPIFAGKFLDMEIEGAVYDASGSVEIDGQRLSFDGTFVLKTEYKEEKKIASPPEEKSPEIILLPTHYVRAYLGQYYKTESKVYYAEQNPLKNYNLQGGEAINSTLHIDMISPSQKIVKSFDGTTDEFGVHYETFIIPNTFEQGMYAVNFTATKDGAKDSKQLFVYITEYPRDDDNAIPLDEPPTILILGDNPYNIDEDTAYVDPGATASDPEDGNITGSIITTNTVDASTLGTYSVTYSVTDSGGNLVTAVRTVIVNNIPETVTLSVQKDSHIRSGSNANRNEGINQILAVEQTKRALIAFSQTEIGNAIGGLDLHSATLRLYVEDSSGWGTSGSTIDIRKVTNSWVEGNGWNDGNNIRGTGSGVTWNCAIDTNINNNQVNCSTQWGGGSYGSITDSVLITSSMDNQFIEFDVTVDIQAFLDGTQNNGWIIRKTSEAQSGAIVITSDEGSPNDPKLVLVFG